MHNFQYESLKSTNNFTYFQLCCIVDTTTGGSNVEGKFPECVSMTTANLITPFNARVRSKVECGWL